MTSLPDVKISEDTLAFMESMDDCTLRRSTPEPDVVLAATLFQMGQDLYGAGCIESALESYAQSLKYTVHVLGTAEHENVAKILYHMATAHHARGELDQAYTAFRDVWRISTAVLGDEEVAESLFQMGRVKRDLGCYRCAVGIFREALKIRVTIHGEQHKDVAVIVCNIAMVHQEMGELDVALSLFQEVLRIGLSLWGPVNKLTAEVLDMIGEIYVKMGEHTSAMVLFNDAHRIAAHVERCEHHKLDGRICSAKADQLLMPSVLSALVCVPRFCAAAA